MCLIVEKGTNKRKAKADILVYKCLDECIERYCTPFRYFPVYFEKGKCVLNVKHFTYRKYRKVINSNYIVNEFRVEGGIHSFRNEWGALKLVKDFHEKDGTNKHYAIIPKGANYYIGDKGDVVSTELIVFETKKDYKEYVKTSDKICIIDKDSLLLQEI